MVTKMMEKIFAVLLTCVALTSYAQENADEYTTVKVIVNDNITMEFSRDVRLDVVLNTALDQWERELGLEPLDIYWPNARLSMLAGGRSEHTELEAKRDEVLAELGTLTSYFLDRNDRERAAQVASLREQLSSMLVAWQPFGTPELGASRLFIENNPRLAPGIYHLTLPEREPYFYVYGLTKSYGKQRIYSQQTVRGYLFGHEENDVLWPDADMSYAYHVHPAEQPKEVPWAVYNAEAVHLMPGDILFLGFEESNLPSRYEGINAQIAELYKHFWHDPSAQFMDNRVEATVEGRIPDVFHWERLDMEPTRSNYGVIGLMQTPTARMAEMGEAAFNYTDMEEYRRYNFTLQVLPWLEAGGFYTQIPNRLYSGSEGFSGRNVLTDKGFNVKFRLWEESEYIPEISLGMRDFAGTGLFSDEYIAASKRWGPLDFTLGIGFGRLGTSDNFINPFCEVSDSYCDRTSGLSGSGGIPELDSWFTGPAAIFGGVEYQTPFPGLRVKLEYEGNDYSRDRSGVDMTPSSPVNIGLNYRVTDYFDIQFGVERGDIFSIGFTLRTNLNTLSQVKITPDRVEAIESPRARSLDDVRWNYVSRMTEAQFAFSGMRVMTDSVNGEEIVRAYVNPLRTRDSDEAVERASRVFLNELPESVDTYEFVQQESLMPVLTTRVPVEDFRAYVQNEVPDRSPSDVSEVFERDEPVMRPGDDDERWVYGGPYSFKPTFGFAPFLDQDFGSPETFQFYQLGVNVFGSTWLDEQTFVNGQIGINVVNNFHKYNFTVDAFDDLPLPRVRTYVREYMLNDVWLNSMQITRMHQFSESFYGMAYAGIFERMYGGVGGEVMWRPLDSRLAVGLDVNWVKQRDFNGAFGFRDYSTTTGFLTGYYQMPWLEDTMLQVGAGRFLAGDTGAAIQLQKRFDSGVIVGAFANLTNVSSEEYGEGSFTKGVFISIPFDLISVLPSRERVNANWIPLSRDGGQQLQRSTALYPLTDIRAPYFQR
ncbi:YjbH domain-containing protein [Lysobacter sp. N42]|nr:YjbH domain-containing protein [Lysobacter sp. N42]